MLVFVPPTMDRYKLIKIIGVGGYSEVHLAKRRGGLFSRARNDERFAIKVITFIPIRLPSIASKF